MYALIKQVEQKFTKKQVVDVRSGDNVKVHQRICRNRQWYGPYIGQFPIASPQ